MISIDRISFEFAMNDESFAHSLYADWDRFCRTCVENIVEECLSAYDKDRVLHEIEMLDLDLGSIPQEDFYSEFPRRLREELQKALPHLQLGHTNMEEAKTAASRFANLLYYLEHGVLKTEWADIDFNLSDELDELIMLDKRYMEKIAELCMANEYVLRRLLLQTDNDVALVRFYSIAMDQTFSVKDGKRRVMEIFLEMQPDLPVRFIHEVEEDGRLCGMAELLDTRSVRKIMEKETEEHAEVDIPPYWHYLYEWLIKYYPFNGLAVFGGKSGFIDHLHDRLLTFIHKRNNTFYLSKTELTAAFLLEVFGAAYYKEMLNAIYDMQPRNADGSPAYDGYYNRELYRIFMQLSLLYVPTGMDDYADETASEDTKSLLQLIHKETIGVIGQDNETTVEEWAKGVHLLENEAKELRAFTGQNDNEIKESIRRLRMLMTAGKITEAVKRRVVVSFLEQHKDRYADAILELHEEGLLEGAINLISLSATESVIRRMSVCYIGTGDAEKLLPLIARLFASENTVSAYLQDKSLTLRTQVLVWLAKETKAQAGTVKPFMELFLLFLTSLFGKENVSVVVRLVVYGMTGEVATDEVKDYDIIDVIDLLPYTGSFMEWMNDTEVATDSKRELLQVLAREKPQELVGILRNLSRGKEAVPLMATHIPTEVLLDVVKKIDAKQALLLSRTIDLLQKERGRFAFLSNMTMPFTTALSEALLLFMQDNDTLDGRNLTEQEVIGKFLAHLYYVYTRKTDYNDNAEWKYLQNEVTNGLGLNGKEELLTDDTLPEEVRKQLLRNYMRSRPAVFLNYIQRLAVQGKLPMDKWAEWADLSEWLWLSASMSLTLEELLRQIVEYLLYQNKLIDETVVRYGLATFIATNDAARFTYYVDKTEVVRSFFLSFPTLVITKIKKEEMMSEMMENLGITPEEEKMFARSQEGDSEIAVIGNAGLCLLSPWFPRLFFLLGYLDEEKRNFKDTASRIRAVFLLQYLACPEEKEYREPELAFNRLLVALPAHIPLPKQIGLTDEEKQTTDDMLEGVKANWSKMNGTSVSGLRQSFIVRNGRLEQQDEKWLLTVENCPYDILLESVPWAFRQIRFPWLKKYVQVFWNEKQTF